MAEPQDGQSGGPQSGGGGVVRQQIQAYGGGGFRISGVRYTMSVLVHGKRTDPWAARAADEITASDIARLVAGAPMGTIVIIGCGAGFLPMPAPLREELNAAGIHADWMDTGAACRTFNVLAAEGREIRAALLAVD